MLEIFASLFETVGTISIAVAALSVHHKVLNEHKIDALVFKKMKKEQRVAKVGVALVVVGFLMEVFIKLF